MLKSSIKATVKAFSAIVKQAEVELKKMRSHLEKLQVKAKTEVATVKKATKKVKAKVKAKVKKKVAKKRKSSKKK
jgi:hypothetical protein